MAKREIHVWSESDGGRESDYARAREAGYTDGHTLGICHGSAVAESLQEAADQVFQRGTGLLAPLEDTLDPLYDRQALTYWGLRLFERKPRYA